MSITPEECARVTLEVVPDLMRTIRSGIRQHRGHDLSVTQFRVLTFVNRNPHASLSDLAEHIGLTLPTLSKMVAYLVERQLIAREAAQEDRRYLALNLTTDGQQMLAQAVNQMQEQLSNQLTRLDSEQREQIVTALQNLQTVFTTAPESLETKKAAY